MGLNSGLYIAKAKPKPFNVMNIAGVCSIEFFEYTRLSFAIHADTIVFYFDGEHVAAGLCFDIYLRVILWILYRIINQVIDEVWKMYLICVHQVIGSI